MAYNKTNTNRTTHTHNDTHHSPQDVTPVLDSDDEESETTKNSGSEEESNERGYPHCHVNYVNNVKYTLIHGNDDKPWATGTFIDPAPAVPKELQDKYKAGDYVLMCGNSLKLKGSKAIFAKDEDFVLNQDWSSMDGDMTADDLFDLDDEPFLLWFQCILPPKKPAAKIKKEPATRKPAPKKRKR